jgi:hypothetical protein
VSSRTDCSKKNIFQLLFSDFAEDIPMIDCTPKTETGKEIVDEIESSYSIYCIDAYSCEGERIRPLDYKRFLVGAVVLVHYGITHADPFGADHSMVLEIFSIIVIVPPKSWCVDFRFLVHKE